MKIFHGSWNSPETVFHKMLWKKKFTLYPSLWILYDKKIVVHSKPFTKITGILLLIAKFAKSYSDSDAKKK